MRHGPSIIERGLMGAALILIVALDATPAAAESRHAEVAGWNLSHFPVTELREMGSSIVGAEMSRQARGIRIEYRVVGGVARELMVQRLNCGEATDEQGGIAFTERVYHVADEAGLVEAVRTQLGALDSGYDEYCPARPAELAEALSGLEAALAQVERWAAEDPLPPLEAWDRSPGEVRRTEPPVTITWSSLYEAPGVHVGLDSCGDDFFSESVQVDAAGDPPARAARAREALAGLLRRAETQCQLHPTQAARLLVGFDEAVAEAETQLLPLEGE
jgi:hypothetical protein